MRVGDIIPFGSWPQKLEGPSLPLHWRVLEVRDDGSALLLTRDIIECRSYHDSRGNITWQNCNLRQWLNGVFAPRAFSPQERQWLMLEHCEAENNNAFRKVLGGGDTEDYVFCLGLDQAQRLFDADAMRQAQLTPYAQRAHSTRWWWLRAPGGHQFAAATVAEQGFVDYNGFHASLDCIGVRPAIVVAPCAVDAPWTPAEAMDFTHAGVALRYGAAAQVPALLHRERLRAETAEVALTGGNPSIDAINSLLDQGVFDHSDRFHLCLSAVRVGASHLAQRLVEESCFDQTHLNWLLKAAVERGSLPLTELVISCGASGEGYAAAYLKAGARPASALCALAAEPQAALGCWEAMQTLPAVTGFAVGFFQRRGQLQLVAQLPHVLEVLARENCLDELRLLLADESVQAADPFEAASYLEAIEAAKRAGHGAAVAFLLDAHATKFGGPRVTGRPNLAL